MYACMRVCMYAYACMYLLYVHVGTCASMYLCACRRVGPYVYIVYIYIYMSNSLYVCVGLLYICIRVLHARFAYNMYFDL